MAAIQSSEDQRTTIKRVCLDAGESPANGATWSVYIDTLLDINKCMVLKSPLFCKTTDAPTADDARSIWLAKQLESDSKTTSTTSSTSSTTSSTATTVSSSPHFLDPTTGEAETSHHRLTRMYVYGELCASLPHHSHLVMLCKRGDFAKLYLAASAFSVTQSIPKFLTALRDLTTLTKSQPWPQFAKKIMNFQSVFESCSVPGLTVSDRVFTECVLKATAVDARYKLEVALIRKRTPFPDLKTVLDVLGSQSHDIESKRGNLVGMAATPPLCEQATHTDTSCATHHAYAAPTSRPPAGRRNTKRPGVCFNFRDTGKCSRGADCIYPHVTPKGVCINCGGSHGLDRCPHRIKEAKLEVQLASLQARETLNTVAQLQAQVSQLQAQQASFSPRTAITAPIAAAPSTDTHLTAQLESLRNELATLSHNLHSARPRSPSSVTPSNKE